METLPPTREELKQKFEELDKKDPKIVFTGAILASGNKLVTDYEQVINLFTEMQNGDFAYPESIRPIVENVKIYQSYIYPGSDQIDWIFRGISHSPSIDMCWRDFPERWGWYAAQYGLTEEAAAHFLKEWGKDEETLEFFERCAEFLSIKA